MKMQQNQQDNVQEKKHNIGRLKGFVNNKNMYDCFLSELEDQINTYQNSLLQASDPVTVHRMQGSIFALQRLILLRDKVNGNN